jgi:osmotically-inducible protein OsmY
MVCSTHRRERSAVGEIMIADSDIKKYVEQQLIWEADSPTNGIGVAGVANDFEVRLAGADRLGADIAREGAFALRSQLPQSAKTIQVVVEHGLPKLEGHVKRDYQRIIAEKTMRQVHGVRAVENHLELPPCGPKNVQRQIVAAFHRLAAVNASHLRVDAIGGIVSLSGTVHSWAERMAAERAAWLAPGVTQVANHITIDSSPAP